MNAEPGRTPVTVLVPVYGGRDDVERCVASVLRHTGAGSSVADAELLIIDDASPDPALVTDLEGVAAGPAPLPVRLLHNAVNRGFVGTVNRGFAEATGDVVILNSDTVVTAGWLDRLQRAAAGPDVATVTPLTNFGSICTLPRSVIDAFALDGDEPRIDECAAFVARHSLGLQPEVICGVGFCMYITRAALDAAGGFDQRTFGQGYGEEVDFCLRATRLGFRHLVEDGTYVYHHGGGSFGAEREERRANASRLLHQRYRWFRPTNRRERADDPLTLPFTALELGLTERRPERPHVLHLLHSPPDDIGGTEKHLDALLTALEDEFDFSILHPVDGGFVLQTRHKVDDGPPSVKRFLLPGGGTWSWATHDAVAAGALRAALDLFHVDAVHIQNLIRHSLAPLDVLADFDGPVVCSVRDLYLACQNYWLMYRNEGPCGIPEDLSACARCLPETIGLSVDDLVDFRGTVASRLDTVDRWVFASQSAADYFLRVYDVDESRIELIPHGAIIDPAGERWIDEPLVTSEPLRVAFVGRGWSKKGLPIVNELADALAGTGIEVHHFGVLKERVSPHLRVHGTYENDLLPDLLRLAGIHVVLLPGVYAETFGHVLTEAWIAGVPVVGTTYGALGERIRATGAGWTLDPTDPAALVQLVRDLDDNRHEVLRATRRAHAVRFLTVAETADRYAALYRLGRRAPAAAATLQEVRP
jgi:GT2 family glycosyltransferase/glycosyltransferase involved in cell wall biosynthesis